MDLPCPNITPEQARDIFLQAQGTEIGVAIAIEDGALQGWRDFLVGIRKKFPDACAGIAIVTPAGGKEIWLMKRTVSLEGI